MRLSHVLALSTVLALGVSTLRAEDAPASAPATTTAPAAPSLEKTMGSMGKAFGQIAKQIKDKDQKESTLKLLSDLEHLVVTAKSLTPPTKKIPEADRAQALVDFRTNLTNVLRELLNTEEQVTQDKFDAASETFIGIKKIMIMGHKEFHVGEK